MVDCMIFVSRCFYRATVWKEWVLGIMLAEHLFGSLSSDATELRHIFKIAAPLPVFGPIAEALFLRRYMMALNRDAMPLSSGSPNQTNGSTICPRSRRSRSQ